MKNLSARESDFSRIRIAELKLNPVKGNFDAIHLREINRRILQDLPGYNGGEFCLSTGEHLRSRDIHQGLDSYVVHYKYGKITESWINEAIAKLGPLQDLKLMSEDMFSQALSQLYGDLDHIHAFNEANSRTLRIFTEQIAQLAQYKLDWTKTNQNENAREVIYQARDIEVSRRSYPDLTIEKMREATSAECEAYSTQKKLKNVKSLAMIFSENISKIGAIRSLKLT